ncbi:uncharacterized protein LOC119349846 isoform X2 [Triticum dicoccoides]|uniref:uncharacterized protein LOC119349846 isoform X2 n=1 Tax=Triticum dicoccoides TaxID=85692 RepID=UPI000E7C05E9|nr:uncharacterized protein LOC119349846 isoform X2 [Triticum dicoccoides]
MPGSIRISDIQPPVTAPLFLQVNVGKKEYSGDIGQHGFSLPVTSIRDSMVMTLYNADKELVSKTEVKTKLIVELGTMDAVFTLDSGGTIILQLQFFLSDEDRKRIQEMRNSVMKRKQQELLGNADELYFQEDSPLPKEHAEDIPGIPSKDDQLTLRKSMSLDDLKKRVVFSETSVDSGMVASKDLPLQIGGNTSMLEGPIDINSKKGQGKPKSRSSSAVKKMISAFESSSPQGLPSVPRIRSESSLEEMPSVSSSETSTNPSRKPPTPGASVDAPGRTQTGLRPGKQAMIIGNKKPSTSFGKSGPSNTQETRRRSSRQSAGASDMIRSEKRSAEKRRRRSIGTYSSEQQVNPCGATSSVAWINHPHVCITTASRQLKGIVGVEHLNSMENLGQGTDDGAARRSDGFPVLNGWLINQGVRGVIVIIACGAVFFNNR